jgi:transcription factor C subunit 6
MARQLRPRKSRPSYAYMAGYSDEDGAGPSATIPSLEDEGDSGSDFVMDEAPVSPADPDEALGFDDDDDDMEVDDLLLRDDDSVVFHEEPPSKGKRKAKPKSTKPISESRKIASLPAAPGLSRSSNRQMYALPTPSVNHRHRAVSLFTRTGRVERLESPPNLFSPAKSIPTNNFTHNANITDRMNKAWGYNVGSGPLWELLEDRSWFKEAIWEEADVEKEESRRPKVHGDVGVKNGWTILDDEHVPYISNTKEFH